MDHLGHAAEFAMEIPKKTRNNMAYLEFAYIKGFTRLEFCTVTERKCELIVSDLFDSY